MTLPKHRYPSLFKNGNKNRRELDSTCTSSGFSRMFFSRASSFRLSKQPSLVYPLAVTLSRWFESVPAFFVSDVQATGSSKKTMLSTMEWIFIVRLSTRVGTSLGRCLNRLHTWSETEADTELKRSETKQLLDSPSGSRPSEPPNCRGNTGNVSTEETY